MAAKLILPLLGGSPAVWTTCMLFFQSALLVGYAYAHVTSARLSAGRQAVLHLAVLLAPLALLPPTVAPARPPAAEASPVLAVLLLLAGSVGAPFLAASATAPMLQRWFSRTGHPAAGDPYFLYAASNVGSMVALLGYPLLVEPRLPLRAGPGLTQTALWSAGYAGLIGLTLLGAIPLWRGRGRARAAPEPERRADAGLGDQPAPPWTRRLWWVLLGLAPSSLLLGATAYITTDIAAIPLLWVLPLALYLLSFIVVFGWWPARAQRVAAALLPCAVLAGLFLVTSELRLRLWLTVLLHLVVLLLVALACHGELARDRPPPRHLTAFYLWLAVGGALGGVFNGLVAPHVFGSLAEYPIAMGLAWALLAWRRAPAGRAGPPGVRDLLLAGAVALLFYGLGRLDAWIELGAIARGLPDAWAVPGEVWGRRLLVHAPPLLLLLCLRRRPAALALAIAGILALAAGSELPGRERLYQGRSFFGVLRVLEDRDAGGFVDLRHGTTLHGRQRRDPARRAEPVSYYYREGPVGQLFEVLREGHAVLRVAVIGLGTGTLAAYARRGDTIDFYEIDPLIRDIALDPAYFTYLADARARGARVGVELGDARVRLDALRRAGSPARYDLIVVDAFSSDAIPIHLLTREALRLYLDLLAPDGLVLVHISNRHLDLAPVVARLAADAAVHALVQHHDDVDDPAGDRSSWVLLARMEATLAPLAEDEGLGWRPAAQELRPDLRVWTDDVHDVLAILKW